MEVWFLLIRFFAHIIGVCIVPIKRLFSNARRIPLPPIEDSILMYSAKQLAEQIRQGQITSQRVINAYIGRIKSVNQILNAVIEDRFVQAMEEAKAVDQFIAETSWTVEEIAKQKPLLGVPLTVKESCSLEGLSLQVGHVLRKGIKSEKDGHAVARLKAAGAIPLLVSATPALCLSVQCDSLIHGETNNAYNNIYNSGGSSGGEAALLGAAASVIGIGSDLAGSLRIPAMFNGIFTHKPTARITPLTGHWPLCNDERFLGYANIGPMVRFAEDLRLTMQTLNTSKEVDFSKTVTLSDLNIFYMDHIEFTFFVPTAQREIKMAVTRSIEHLWQKCGMKVSETKFKFLNNILDSCMAAFLNIEDKPDLYKHPFDETKRYSKFVVFWKSLFSKSIISHFLVWFDLGDQLNMCIPKSNTDSHMDKIASCRQHMIDELKDNGVFILPTFPTSAFRYNEVAFNICGVLYTLPFNLFGFPSTQVPMGLDDSGMPIGIQVIAAPYQDHLCIAVAEELARAFGGWTPPTPMSAALANSRISG